MKPKNMTTPRLIKSTGSSSLRLGFSLAALALACFALPTETRSDCGETGDIPFTVTLLKPLQRPEACLHVVQDGGLGRQSSGMPLPDLTPGQPCTFYAANRTIWPITGSWEVEIRPSCGRFPGDVKVRKVFFLHEDDNFVNITVEKRGILFNYDIKISTGASSPKKTGELAAEGINTLQESQVPPPRELAAEAWLGDSKDPSGRPDSDMFSFVGAAGDTVRLRLDPDTKGGNNEGHATLRFVGPPAREVTGTLPLQFPIQLGSTAKYDIAIEQPGGQVERYRGGYILRIESAQGTIHGLMPADSVEK